MFVFLNLLTLSFLSTLASTTHLCEKCTPRVGGQPDLLGTKTSSVWLHALWSPSRDSAGLFVRRCRFSFHIHPTLGSPVSPHRSPASYSHCYSWPGSSSASSTVSVTQFLLSMDLSAPQNSHFLTSYSLSLIPSTAS